MIENYCFDRSALFLQFGEYFIGLYFGYMRIKSSVSTEIWKQIFVSIDMN